MRREELVACGYVIARRIERPSYLDAGVFPEFMVSASDFVAPILPSVPPGWIEAADTAPGRFSGFADAAQGNLLWALEADLQRFGLDGSHSAMMSDWLSIAWMRGDFDPPSAFSSVDAARRFLRDFGPAPPDTLILGLALRAEDVEAASDADDGITFVSRLTQRGVPPEEGGRVLGYDVYGVGDGELRAWIRGRGAVKRLAAEGVQPDGNGLLPDLDSAVTAARHMSGTGTGWFAWQLTSYPVTAG
jgi:hypothetical protein